MIDPRIAPSSQPPAYTQLRAAIEQLRDRVPVAQLNRDIVYDLFHRGILERNDHNQLRLSVLGQSVIDAIAQGGHAAALD